MQSRAFDRITVNLEIPNSPLTIRSMRLSLRRVLEAFAAEPSWDDLRADYPALEREDIRQALEYAAVCIDDEIPAVGAV